MRIRNIDMLDLIGGIGIGLCFSIYWKIGILLLFISVMTAGYQLEKEKKKKERKLGGKKK